MKKQMMRERFKLFWLGIFIILAVIVMAWLLLFLRPSVGDGKKTLRVRFSNIERVMIGTRVTFAGKPVGEVYAINEIFDARSEPTDSEGNIYFYELVLHVDSSVKVYNYDEIIFSTSGLLGEKNIAIIPKLAPPGKPPAHEVTTGILYGHSTDKLEETLNELREVAMSFDKTLDRIADFLDENREDLHLMIHRFAIVANQAHQLLERANGTDFFGRASSAADAISTAMTDARALMRQALDSNLIARMNTGFDAFSGVLHQINSGEGTFGRLLYNDNLYLQLAGTLSHIDTVVNDISNYGLLFQYDKGWQRKRLTRIHEMNRLCTPCDFYNYFGQELNDIAIALNRVSQAVQTSQCKQVSLDDPCFSDKFLELINKLEQIEYDLKAYQLKLSEQGCSP